MPPKRSKRGGAAVTANRFGSLDDDASSSSDSGTEGAGGNNSNDEAAFKRLMQQKKAEKEALRKAEHEQLKLKKKQEADAAAAASQEQQSKKKVEAPAAVAAPAASAAAESKGTPKPKSKKGISAAAAAAASSSSTSGAAATAPAAVPFSMHLAAATEPAPIPSPVPDRQREPADAATSTAVTAAAVADGADDVDNLLLAAESPALPLGPQEEQLMEVLDKFNVAHSSSIEKELEEDQLAAAAADSAAAASEQMRQAAAERLQRRFDAEADLPSQPSGAAAAAASGDGSGGQFADHGVLLSAQKRAERAQHFDYFLLLDFECACDEAPGFDLEIIEVPALLFDTRRRVVVDEFHTYCRPLRNPVLTQFCTQLTGIRQEQVSNAPCYDEVLQQLLAWLKEALAKQEKQRGNNNGAGASSESTATICVMTDGPCDLELFAYLFMHKRDGFLFPSLFGRFLDVKQAFKNEYADGRYVKIKEMLSIFGMSFQGSQHSGIDDTRNLARVVAEMCRRGTVFDDVCYVTSSSGSHRVPMYLWKRAMQTVKALKQREAQSRGAVALIGIGPQLAEKARAAAASSSSPGAAAALLRENAGKAAAATGSALRRALAAWLTCRVEVRPGEFVRAPSTFLLALLLALFVGTVFAM